MRKNRKTTKQLSVVAVNTMRFGVIMVVFCFMAILNFLSSSSCTQLLKVKGEREREIERLEDSRMRELTRWEEMKTPEKIEAALLHHGLSMKPPRPEQNVRMMPDGTPRPGQISLARAKMRTGVTTAKAVRPAVATSGGQSRSQYRRGGRSRR